MSQLKIKDSNDQWIDIPASGVGVPSGGTTGQVLQKSSNTDYATQWATPQNIVLLWENPNPEQALANGTISIPTDYPLYLMIADREAGENIMISVFFPNGKGPQVIGGSGWYNYVYERGYPWVDGVGLQVQGGYKAGNHTANNNICVALRIYGIRL